MRINVRKLFYRKLDDGRESLLTAPITVIAIFIGITVFVFLFFRNTSERISTDSRLPGGGVTMDQTAQASRNYEEVEVTQKEDTSALESLRGFDLLEKPKTSRTPSYSNQIVDSLNSDVARLYNNDSLSEDSRYGESGMFSDDSDYLRSLLNQTDASGIALNERLDALLHAAGCSKVEHGKYETQRGRTIFPKDFKDIQSLLNDLGFTSEGSGRYTNKIGVILDFNKENFKGGTRVEGLYYINPLSGEMVSKEIILTTQNGSILTPDGIELNIDTDGVLTDRSGRFSNIQNEGEFETPDGKIYAIKKVSLAASIPINPNAKRDEHSSADPVIIYGKSMFPDPNATEDSPNGYDLGNYLPKGYRIPVVLLSPYRSDVENPMLVFAAYRDVTTYGKLQIPMGTRFIAKATAEEGQGQGQRVSNTTTVPPGDRIRFSIQSILYPDGSETPMSGVVLDKSRMIGLKGYYIPLPAYVQAYPLMSEFSVSMLQRWALGDTERAQNIVLGSNGSPFTLSEDERASDAAVNASMSAIREFANRYTQVLYQRNQPHVKLPAGKGAYIQLLENVDLSVRELPFSGSESNMASLSDSLNTGTELLTHALGNVDLNGNIGGMNVTVPNLSEATTEAASQVVGEVQSSFFGN